MYRPDKNLEMSSTQLEEPGQAMADWSSRSDENNLIGETRETSSSCLSVVGWQDLYVTLNYRYYIDKPHRTELNRQRNPAWIQLQDEECIV